MPDAELRMKSEISIFCAAVLFLAGCGGKFYEERLANTSILLAHIGQLNDNLQPKWTDAETGVSLRAPLQFTILPPPAKPELSAEDKAKPPEERPPLEEVPDERQPKYLNVELPGLRGAFEAKVKVIGENNSEATADAWLYVMTNHHLAGNTDQAKEFNQTVVKNLGGALHLNPPPADSFDSVHFPAKVGTFVKPVKYMSVVITPSEFVGGVARQFSVYLYEQNEIQVVILFVLPQNVDSSEKLDTERIPLCLETLEVTGDRLILPTGGSVGGAGGTQPTF
jgi:hypothetical protein